MRAPVDHEARRAQVSEAVWLVLAARSFGGLTLRAVAAQMGVSTGLLTHYFRDKRALVRHAVDVAEQRADQRTLHTPEQDGLSGLRAALLDVLPLTPELAGMSRIWVGYWDGALADEDLWLDQQQRYARWRAALCEHIEAARQRGEIGDVDAEGLAAISSSEPSPRRHSRPEVWRPSMTAVQGRLPAAWDRIRMRERSITAW